MAHCFLDQVLFIVWGWTITRGFTEGPMGIQTGQYPLEQWCQGVTYAAIRGWASVCGLSTMTYNALSLLNHVHLQPEVQDVSEKSGRETMQMGQTPEWVFWVFIGKPNSDRCRTNLTALFLSNWSTNSIIKITSKWWLSYLKTVYSEGREW